MQLQAYQGYYENGYFYTDGKKIQLPARRKMTILLEDDFIQDNKMDEQEINKRLEMVKSLRGIIPTDIDTDALREERITKRGLL